MPITAARGALSSRSYGSLFSSAYRDTVLVDSPSQFWRMDDVSGTGMRDYVSLNNSDSGTYTGGYTLLRQGIPGDTGGKSVLFDGTTGFASYPATTITGTSFTLEGWIYLPVPPSARSDIVNQGTANIANEGVFLYVNSANTLTCDLSLNVGPVAATTVPVAAWTHVAVVFTAGSAQLYMNGAATGASMAMSPAISGAVANQIGNAAAYTEYFPGYISNVAVYNYALTASRLAQHYHIGSQL